ncbi:hypothetical protein Anapl_19027 [Anas platyrhynchos]|uniref:Uncharacterized protein n=1 Tax=Anas platyrhynchos TaxID=8839 RepID=R0L2K6_ANAPL|nr:hypothetical protein Anapl_19027 [Anas platyrhynchos]
MQCFITQSFSFNTHPVTPSAAESLLRFPRPGEDRVCLPTPGGPLKKSNTTNGTQGFENVSWEDLGKYKAVSLAMIPEKVGELFQKTELMTTQLNGIYRIAMYIVSPGDYIFLLRKSIQETVSQRSLCRFRAFHYFGGSLKNKKLCEAFKSQDRTGYITPTVLSAAASATADFVPDNEEVTMELCCYFSPTPQQLTSVEIQTWDAITQLGALCILKLFVSLQAQKFPSAVDSVPPLPSPELAEDSNT